MESSRRPKTLWPMRDGAASETHVVAVAQEDNAESVTGAAWERGREAGQKASGELAPHGSQRRVQRPALITPGRHLLDPAVTDPWERYEPRARVKGPFEIILARHRITKSRLVAMQPLRDIDSITAVAQIRRNSHRSFLELLDHMAHGPQQYLVWEPWEASLADVLASNCDVTDHEIAEIIWPVLSGIAFLRKQGLALASLTESHVLLMAKGSVKIAGAERCQAVPLTDRDPGSWQLTALSGMAARLLTKNKSHRPRNADVLRLPRQLLQCSVDDLIRDASFTCMSGHGELVALAKVANMTAFRNVEFL